MLFCGVKRRLLRHEKYLLIILTLIDSQGAPATQTQEWLTQPVVGGDISFVDLDADARKRAKSGTSFETEGDSVIALDDVSRPRSAPSRMRVEIS